MNKNEFVEVDEKKCEEVKNCTGVRIVAGKSLWRIIKLRMCSICRTQKEEAEFRLMKKQNRRNSYCKDCERWYMRNYMRAYRERIGG